MAGQDRGPSFDLKLDLLKEGHSFSFFQIIRLLRLFIGPTNKSDQADGLDSEYIRIRPNLSLSFPPSDVERIEEIEGQENQFLVTANFLGLYGNSSPLPTFYTEDLIDEVSDDESVTRDFLDIINHRLFQLLFQCWSKNRQYLKIVEEHNFHYLQRLFCLIGLGEDEIRQDVSEPYQLLRYVGLLTQLPRSSLGLKTLLRDALYQIPLKIIPCIPRKTKIPDEQKLLLGWSGSVLGVDSFLGEEIADRMGMFRIQLGPVEYGQFQKLLPEGEWYQKLTSLTKLYVVEPLDYDIEIILSDKQIQTACLGATQWSRLGLDTWLFSGDNLGDVRARFYPEV